MEKSGSTIGLGGALQERWKVLQYCSMTDTTAEEEMPEEVNIDELLDLKTDEERTLRLQEILHTCNKSTQVFISELLLKLQGLQKQEDLHNDGIDLPQLHIYSTRSGSADREVLH
ncbi:protein phosphatase 1 regulatory subunit 14A-like protein [Lates japonicus]|uniref:Protein phosphatase 1 regulatory subunit 14A-like protein n=1 Tax=Lates japonicus TaxID=270547 RepID=A0AAD3RH75_LATJO|nr:protein phosphatase 1 regulatory subunit 14A-like protein [Lates japonicus]